MNFEFRFFSAPVTIDHKPAAVRARFGQFIFENGGVLDRFELVGNNEFLTNSRDEYRGTDEDCEDFYEEWAENLIETLNSEA